MRTRNSIKNIITAMCTNIVSLLIGFVAQAIFINILGAEYLGINGLFINIISILSIVELGIGTAIVYNLYKPVAYNDIETIKSLMFFYKKTYSIVAIVVLILGLIIMPFLSFFTGEVNLNININIVYILFIIDAVCSYLLSYKRNILYANQKNYIINVVHMLYLFFLNILQLLLLYFTKNYYLYLIIKVIMRILENIVITILVNKLYPYLTEKNARKIDKNIEIDIKKKVKALFFHKIGSFIVLGTDNIIISKFLGLVSVGLYSNYYLIINSVQTVFNQVIQATTSSVGNLLVTNDNNNRFLVFKRIRFFNFWISCLVSIIFLVVMQDFITVWIGSKYLLSLDVLIILILNYYFNSSRATYSSFKDAAGIYYEDRFVPLIESFVNIVSSIILLHFFGLAGVFMGTFISGLALWCFSYPKYVYKKLFNRSYLNYAKETMGYILIFGMLAFITCYVSLLINFNNVYLQLFADFIIAFTIPNLILLIIFFRTENFKYYLNLLKSFSKKKVKS